LILKNCIGYQKYAFEIFFGLILIFYAIQFYSGKKHNEAMSLTWLHKNMKFFEDQFACIGVGEESANTANAPAEGETKFRGAMIEQHSYNLFKFYATGRMNCSYCLATLEMKRRQDLFTMATFNLLWPEIDRVSYEIPLAVAEPFPCIFALVKRNEMKIILENNKILVFLINS
jgi:hypothetical protein